MKKNSQALETTVLKSVMNEIIFRTESKEAIMEYEFSFSNHSLQRSQQRGISKELIAMATEYGTCYYAQGLHFYVLGKKDIPLQVRKNASKYENTIVVFSAKRNEVLTCYRNANPYSYIKHKRRDLITRAA